MKKIVERPLMIYSGFLLFTTILSVVLMFFDYHLIVYNEIAWLVLTVLTEVTLALCIAKREKSTMITNIISQLLPLFSFIYICVVGGIVDGVNDLFLILNALICFISCYAISFLYRNTRILKIVCAIINSILLLLLLLASFLIMLFGQIGQNTIVKKVMSPGKAYTAILIDSDHGALGGDTLVDVEHNTSEINVWLGRLIRITRTYAGGWGEFESMLLMWQDEGTLLINGKPYSID